MFFQSSHYAQLTLDGGYSCEIQVSELKLEPGIVDSGNEKVKKYSNYQLRPGDPRYEELLLRKNRGQKSTDGSEVDTLTNIIGQSDDGLIDRVIEIASTEPPLKRKDAAIILAAAQNDLDKVRTAFELAEAYPNEIRNLTGFIIEAIKNDYGTTSYTLKKKKKPAGGLTQTHDYDFSAIELKKRQKKQ